MRKVIVSCALTGGADTRSKNPNVPVTPAELADQACEAGEAGAAIVHIHVRDPVTTKPSVDFALYEETVQLMRKANCKALINLTTGPGSIYEAVGISPITIRHATAINPEMTPEMRVDHVLRLLPSVCSLDIATLNVPEGAMINVIEHLTRMAALIGKTTVVPELEVFDLGHIRLAKHLIDRGVLKGPGFFQFCLGVTWGAPATKEVLALMKSMLPEGALWSAFGVGPEQFPIVEQAAALGGHVRVGLEDNLYLERGKLAKSNADLVRKAVEILGTQDCEPASAAEAAAMLGAVA